MNHQKISATQKTEQMQQKKISALQMEYKIKL